MLQTNEYFEKAHPPIEPLETNEEKLVKEALI
jgi:hypothetical protein